MRKLLLLSLLMPLYSASQISGVVLDEVTSEPIYNVRVESGDVKLKTDFDGAFELDVTDFPRYIVFSAMEYFRDSILVDAPIDDLIVRLKSEVKQLKSVVVSANRRAQEVEEVPISMEILPAKLIEQKGFTDLEQAVDQSPGVFAMDGQVSIRGGGGYAYGVGSRVLVLMNGIPLVSPDAGDAKWNSVPLENINQIEVIKGASSVLYGSGALNGVISMSTKEPSLEGDYKIRVQSGIYDNPKRQSLKWWDRNPTFHLVDIGNGKMYKNWGYTVSANGVFQEGFRAEEIEKRGRLTGTLYFRPEKNERLKIGVNYSAQYQNVTNWILWESDSLAYTPQDGTLNRMKALRINFDPYLKYFDKKGNRHFISTRYYLVTSGNESNVTDAATANLGYADYQFAKKILSKHTLTMGLTNSNSLVRSRIFGDHSSINSAMYAQYEHVLNKLDITVGLRLEYFKQDNRIEDSRFEWNNGNSYIPIYPVLRGAVHYAPLKFTHLRASFGQGIRFPSVAERYAATSNGGVIVFPNPDLEPEKGWSSELGVKQVLRMGEWKGILDIAGFINQYSNMIEFAFGLYIPDSIPLSFNPDDLGYINNWLGFSAQNAEEARITGIEMSFNSSGYIGKVELNSLIGYTYMNPVSLNTSQSYVETFSDSSNMLKYRFNHLAKCDISADFRGWSLGVSSRYSSYMRNIDALFEDGFQGVEVLPGLKNYRLNNQQGNLVFDARFGKEIKEKYRVAMIINNILNAEYSSRPGDLQPPRNFIVQLQCDL